MVMGLDMTLRNETVAEKSGRLFVQLPFGTRRPERGEFMAGKSGTHTDAGVMPRDGVATDEPETTGGSERDWRTAWLARNEQIRSCCSQA